MNEKVNATVSMMFRQIQNGRLLAMLVIKHRLLQMAAAVKEFINKFFFKIMLIVVMFLIF